jgi:hypothetical protein
MLAMCLALLTGPAAFAEGNPDNAAPIDPETVGLEADSDVSISVLGFVEAEAADDGDTFPWGQAALWVTVVGFVAGLVYLLMRGSRRMRLTWRAAYGWGFVIFAYFVLTTTWFPSWLLSQQSVANAPGWASDLIGSGAWFVPLVIGLVALRWLQKTERI